MSRKSSRGFTLIELVIAVAIIGILASIAFPSYQYHMRKVRREACAASMMQLASIMESSFSRNGNQYLDVTVAPLNLFSATCPIDGAGPVSYNLIVGNLAASTYTLSATPVGAQGLERCGTLTLTNLLQKGQVAGMTVAECWQ